MSIEYEGEDFTPLNTLYAAKLRANYYACQSLDLMAIELKLYQICGWLNSELVKHGSVK